MSVELACFGFIVFAVILALYFLLRRPKQPTYYRHDYHDHNETRGPNMERIRREVEATPSHPARPYQSRGSSSSGQVPPPPVDYSNNVFDFSSHHSGGHHGGGHHDGHHDSGGGYDGGGGGGCDSGGGGGDGGGGGCD